MTQKQIMYLSEFYAEQTRVDLFCSITDSIWKHSRCETLPLCLQPIYCILHIYTDSLSQNVLLPHTCSTMLLLSQIYP